MKFYRDFAAAYGTLWLLMLLIALVTTSHVRTGEFGLFGFPIISIIYALIARNLRNKRQNTSNGAFSIFLEMYPHYKNLPIDEQALAFAEWRNQVKNK